MILDGHGVGEHQRFRAVRARANAVDGATSRFNPYKIVAEIIKLMLDPRLTGLADGHHANHRGDPDGDTQDREHASQLVAQQRDDGGPQQRGVIHFSSSFFSDPILSIST